MDDDEEAEEHPAPRNRNREQPFEIVRVEDPNAMEFPADSKEEAAQMFKDGAEIVATVREPNLFIVKWMEDGPVAENDNGERFALFVFFPGQGGGPLLAQTDANGGFGLQVFKNLDAARQLAGQIPGMEDIHNNRDAHEDWPADLRENFFYYIMDEIEPLEDEEEVELDVLDNNLTEGLEDWKELKTFEDVWNFGQGAEWTVSGGYGMSKEKAEQFYNNYIDMFPGMVFVGKGEGKNRLAAMKKSDGTIFNVFDVNGNQVKDLETGVEPEESVEWKELPTFQDVAKFGEGSQWIVAQPKRNGEQYFKFYTNKGDVFVGRGEGENRVLALKKPDGTIYNMYDIHNKKVEK